MIKVSNPFANIPPLFSDLAKSLAGEIECGKDVLDAYSKDTSLYTIRPQAIIYPKNSTDIKQALSFAREYMMPLTVRGNGTGNQGGALGEGIIIDMSRYFTHIRQINMLEHTITVDAGVSVQELREKLRGWNMDIPLLTAQDNQATVGALVATKSLTPTSFHFGTIREWVEAITVVVDTGEEHRIADGITPSGRLLGIYQAIFPILSAAGPVLRAAKPETSDDATGYCIWNTSIGPRQLIDQITGSEGTLGIITTVTLRLVPYKKARTTICIPFTESALLTKCVELSQKHKAQHMFLYDSTCMELAERYYPGSTPPFPDARYVLAVSFFGNSKVEVDANVRTYLKSLSLQEDQLFIYQDTSFIEKISNPSFLFSLLETYTQGSHSPVSICDGLIVSASDYTALLDDLENYLYSIGKLYVITGNSGSGHLSVVTLFDPYSPLYEQDIENYSQTIFTMLKKYNGGMSGRSGEGIGRTPYLPIFYNEATIKVFTNIKSAWDPLSILNPGKKIGITTTYIRNHLMRKDGR